MALTSSREPRTRGKGPPLHFNQYGRTFQLRIDTPADLEAVLELDESLWAATSAPATVFRCDPRLTELLDSDGNGRINTHEVKGAIRWLFDVLGDHSGIGRGVDSLSLSAIRQESSVGHELLGSARYALRTLGETADDHISLSQVRAFLGNLQQQPLNGDGIVVPEAAPDPATRQYIEDLLAATEGVADASGRQGVSEASIAAFDEATDGFLSWREKGKIPSGEAGSGVMPLGSETSGVYAVFVRYADKIDLYFDLARAAQYDPSLAERLRPGSSGPGDVEFSKLETLNEYLARGPVAAPPEEGKLVVSGEGVNPLYRPWIAELREKVLGPVLGAVSEVLTEDEWIKVRQTLDPHGAYLAEKAGECVESIPVERLEDYRGGACKAIVEGLIEEDRQVASIRAAVQEVERLLLYHAHLMQFADNFVSFGQLYSVSERAMFEMGSAVIDGRWFNLALKVDDLAGHSGIAATSNIFTSYLEVTGRTDDETFVVAIPATHGARGNLGVGKRGVFFDTDGKEYDARVVRVIENPISLREALAAPFVRLWDFVLGKIEALAGASEKNLQKSTETLMKKPPAQAASPGGVQMPGGPAGLMVGLSVSVAAIGSAFAFMTKTLSGMSRGQVLMGLAGAACVVLVPVCVIAILKLRKQDLSSLLEGCGWAINARMRLSRPLRRQFTRRVFYPAKATGTPGYRWIILPLILILVGVLSIGGYAFLRSRAQKQPEAVEMPQEEGAVPPADAGMPST